MGVAACWGCLPGGRACRPRGRRGGAHTPCPQVTPTSGRRGPLSRPRAAPWARACETAPAAPLAAQAPDTAEWGAPSPRPPPSVRPSSGADLAVVGEAPCGGPLPPPRCPVTCVRSCPCSRRAQRAWRRSAAVPRVDGVLVVHLVDVAVVPDLHIQVLPVLISFAARLEAPSSCGCSVGGGSRERKRDKGTGTGVRGRERERERERERVSKAMDCAGRFDGINKDTSVQRAGGWSVHWQSRAPRPLCATYPRARRCRG